MTNPLQSLKDNANLILNNHNEMVAEEVFREIAKIKGEFNNWSNSLDSLITDDWDLLEDMDAIREDFVSVVHELDDVFEVRNTNRPSIL